MVDDATSRLMHLQFVPAETTFNYFAAVRSYIRLHGKPRAFYSDKFSVFRVNIPNALSGTGLTQFGRAIGAISIEYKGQALAYTISDAQERQQAQVTPSKLIDAALSRPAQRGKPKTYHPPMSHPWKYFDYSENSMEAMERRGDICILRK